MKIEIETVFDVKQGCIIHKVTNGNNWAKDAKLIDAIIDCGDIPYKRHQKIIEKFAVLFHLNHIELKKVKNITIEV